VCCLHGCSLFFTKERENGYFEVYEKIDKVGAIIKFEEGEAPEIEGVEVLTTGGDTLIRDMRKSSTNSFAPDLHQWVL
jgi:hypothetical protein